MSINQDPIIHVWITKYALTNGIYEADMRHCVSVSDKMVTEDKQGGYYNASFHKPYWHLTKEEAIAMAEVMRTKKIASLKKAIKKLEAMKFEVVETAK